jgi:hypothetical protein
MNADTKEESGIKGKSSLSLILHSSHHRPKVSKSTLKTFFQPLLTKLTTSNAKIYTTPILLVLLASVLATALPSRESPTTWQVANYDLSNDTGNGYTYSFQLSGEAPDCGFNTLCTGSTVQAGAAPCVQNSALTAAVYSTGSVDGVEGFELQAAFEGATGEVQVPAGESSFEIVFEEG